MSQISSANGLGLGCGPEGGARLQWASTGIMRGHSSLPKQACEAGRRGLSGIHKEPIGLPGKAFGSRVGSERQVEPRIQPQPKEEVKEPQQKISPLWRRAPDPQQRRPHTSAKQESSLCL